MITEEQLAEWERLTNEAQPGPWRIEEFHGRADVVCPSQCGALCDGVAESCCSAEFVVASREAVPALIAEVRRLRLFLRLPPLDEATARVVPLGWPCHGATQPGATST